MIYSGLITSNRFLEDYLRGSYEEAETLDTLKRAFDLTDNEQTDQQETGDDDADN